MESGSEAGDGIKPCFRIGANPQQDRRTDRHRWLPVYPSASCVPTCLPDRNIRLQSSAGFRAGPNLIEWDIASIRKGLQHQRSAKDDKPVLPGLIRGSFSLLRDISRTISPNTNGLRKTFMDSEGSGLRPRPQPGTMSSRPGQSQLPQQGLRLSSILVQGLASKPCAVVKGREQ